MAVTPDPRERLQPALLDRLTDNAPGVRVESEENRVMSKAQLRQAVLRDLSWLFNSLQGLGPSAERDPVLAGCVLQYGLPALAGQQASKLDVAQLEKIIRLAIQRFEPRILADTVEVRARRATSVLDTHNVIEFEIRAELWAQPVPLEVLLRTEVDLEVGQVEVREASGVVRPMRT